MNDLPVNEAMFWLWLAAQVQVVRCGYAVCVPRPAYEFVLQSKGEPTGWTLDSLSTAAGSHSWRTP